MGGKKFIVVYLVLLCIGLAVGSLLAYCFCNDINLEIGGLRIMHKSEYYEHTTSRVGSPRERKRQQRWRKRCRKRGW